MGRTIPSITFRIEEKMRDWENLYNLLDLEEKKCFKELLAYSRKLRSGIMECDNDLSSLLLLSMLIQVKKELNRMKGVLIENGICKQPGR